MYCDKLRKVLDVELLRTIGIGVGQSRIMMDNTVINHHRA